VTIYWLLSPSGIRPGVRSSSKENRQVAAAQFRPKEAFHVVVFEKPGASAVAMNLDAGLSKAVAFGEVGEQILHGSRVHDQLKACQVACRDTLVDNVDKAFPRACPSAGLLNSARVLTRMLCVLEPW
jgi:hypothetical protein